MSESYNIEGIENICDTVWGKEAFSKACETVRNGILAAETMLSDVDKDADASTVYHDLLTEMKHGLSKALSDDWDTLRANLEELNLRNLPSSRKVSDKRIPVRIKETYNRVKKDIKETVLETLMPGISEELLYKDWFFLSGFRRGKGLCGIP